MTPLRKDDVMKVVNALRRERAVAQGLNLPRTAIAIDHAIWVLRAELTKQNRRPS